MAKQIENPTTNILRIQYKGAKYEVAPLDSIVVSDSVADFWKQQHGFIVVKEVDTKEQQVEEASKVEQEEESKTEEPLEEEKEVEEKPKKRGRKPSKK